MDCVTVHTALTEHLTPAVNRIYQCQLSALLEQTQMADESMDSFHCSVKQIVVTCTPGDKNSTKVLNNLSISNVPFVHNRKQRLVTQTSLIYIRSSKGMYKQNQLTKMS